MAVSMTIQAIIEKLQKEAASTRFSFLVRICTEHFGTPRIKGSHHIFKTPWPGDPRLNLQSSKGRAKPYQVEQVISALKKLENVKDAGESEN
jgi:hypothetical protein